MCKLRHCLRERPPKQVSVRLTKICGQGCNVGSRRRIGFAQNRVHAFHLRRIKVRCLWLPEGEISRQTRSSIMPHMNPLADPGLKLRTWLVDGNISAL